MPILLQDYIDWLWFIVPYWRWEWAKAFSFTQLVEIPFYLLLLHHFRPELRWYRLLLLAFGASAITHPFVWFLYPYFTIGHSEDFYLWLGIGRDNFYWYVVVPSAEIFAVGVEALYLSRLRVSKAQALGWAFLANGASFGLGLLSRDVLGWW